MARRGLRGWRGALAATAPVALLLGACGDSDDDAAPGDGDEQPSPDTTAGEPDEVLRIHVTNDDGIGAEGLDMLVETLADLDAVELHVVAPAENQSGSSDNTTGGALTSSDATTAGGHEAVAVDGFPADTVIWAHEDHFVGDVEPPHLTVSGNNEGQNLGPIAYISGTVGAARESARHGVPALAVSQGLGQPPDYAAAAPFVVDWVEENREALIDGGLGVETIWSINVPTCTEGEVRGLVETTRDPGDGEDPPNPLGEADCTATADPEGLQDVEAFQIGYATLTEVEIEAPS